MTNTSPPETADNDCKLVDLSELISQFYASPETLAKFEAAGSAPVPFDDLLDHNHHMTVTVERFHEDLVDVVVHRSRSVLKSGESVWHSHPEMTSEQRLVTAGTTVSYSREITLTTHGTGSIVQYGIVRLKPALLQHEVWMEIASGKIPLGRVLINHNVLRSVQLCQLWKVQSGVALSKLLGTQIGETVYGRTALINCDGLPAIELLEIVKV